MTASRSELVLPREALAGAAHRAAATVSLLALAVWLGGLLVLGAIVAPTVFSWVAMPASADAMTVVFQRFDGVAMVCAAVVLGCEAMRAAARVRFTRSGCARAVASVAASALAVLEGTVITPKIAALHAGGAVRGVGPAGVALSRLHDWAELCGKAEVLLLVVALVFFVPSLLRPREQSAAPSGASFARG